MALHEMDPTRRFSSRAEAYRRFRPDYPAALFVHLLASSPGIVADLGAGTGISSLQLAERGVDVLAIEPNDGMREAGTRHPRVQWVEGSAEATTLPDRSVDLVTCFQAFHWFDPGPAIDEMCRILKPDGSIAAIWNERDPDDPFTRAYGEIVREVSENHPAESRENTVSALYESDRLGQVIRSTFPHEQVLDFEGLLGRAASTSYLPSEGPRHAELLSRLETLFDDWRQEGTVRLLYVTSLYLTTPVEQTKTHV